MSSFMFIRICTFHVCWWKNFWLAPMRMLPFFLNLTQRVKWCLSKVFLSLFSHFMWQNICTFTTNRAVRKCENGGFPVKIGSWFSLEFSSCWLFLMTLISLIVTQKTETNLTCLGVFFQKWKIPYLNRLETMGSNGLHTRANAGLTLKPSISKYKFSKLISIHFLNRFRDIGKRSKHFCFGDFLINSHNLFFWLCIDIVRRKYMFVTLEI